MSTPNIQLSHCTVKTTIHNPEKNVCAYVVITLFMDTEIGISYNSYLWLLFLFRFFNHLKLQNSSFFVSSTKTEEWLNVAHGLLFTDPSIGNRGISNEWVLFQSLVGHLLFFHSAPRSLVFISWYYLFSSLLISSSKYLFSFPWLLY